MPKRQIIIEYWKCRKCGYQAGVDYRLTKRAYPKYRHPSPKAHAVKTGHSKFTLELVSEETEMF